MRFSVVHNENFYPLMFKIVIHKSKKKTEYNLSKIESYMTYKFWLFLLVNAPPISAYVLT